jgi:PRTRC genetic system protein C
MITVTQPIRVIKYKDQELPDINPGVPMEDVMKMHAATHPELSTANLEGPVIKDGKAVYAAQTRLGTKG